MQHAENGGEINLYGYYPDGLDVENKILFEYDEPAHYADVYGNILKERDLNRQYYLYLKTSYRILRYNLKANILYESV